MNANFACASPLLHPPAHVPLTWLIPLQGGAFPTLVLHNTSVDVCTQQPVTRERDTITTSNFLHPMAPGPPAFMATPRKRQKLTTTACEPCRNRKIRCDGNKPTCEACAKRSQQCIYQATPDIKSANEYVDSLVNRVAQLEQELNNAHATILRLSNNPIVPAEPQPPPQQIIHQQPFGNIDPRLLPEHERAALEQSSVDAMGGDAGIDTPDNGQTFYGSSSAHEFTRQMYGTILQNNTAPSMTESTEASPSLQQPSASATAYMASENFSLLPRELADHLMHLYWDRVHVLYPFLHKTSFMGAYEDLWKPAVEYKLRNRPGLGLGASKDSGPSSVIFHCAFNAAMALGMQFADLPLDEKERVSATCLAKSKDLLRLDLFDNGDIALVQTLLLLTQYFQSTHWPNKCWTTIGLACRLAQGLGLHVEGASIEQQLSVAECEMRRRAWHGCVTLDIIVSMTLGRPAMLVGSTSRSLPAPIDGDDDLELQGVNDQSLSSIEFFREAVKLYRIVGRILLSIYKTDDGHTEKAGSTEEDTRSRQDIVVGFDEDLTRFTNELPTGLGWQQSNLLDTDTSGILARQSHVLHVRVLHARILLHRPGFLQYCRTYKDIGGDNGQELTQDDIALPLACTHTGLELIRSVREYSATEATGAWWYNVFYTRTAAMVVLLSGVCPPIREQIGDEPWEEAWSNCVEILTKNLPQYAPVKSCLNTLTALRQNVLRERGKGEPKDGQQISTDTNPHSYEHLKDLSGSALIDDQQLLDSTVDPFIFVESDLFTDFGFDFSQPLV